MSLTTAQDINVVITVPDTTTTNNSSSANTDLVRTERRINPSWTISQLKSKLESITGIPASSQEIHHIYSFSNNTNNTNNTSTNTPQQTPKPNSIILTPDTSLLTNPAFNIHHLSHLEIHDLRPPSSRQNFTDTTSVEKYEMPVEQYAKLDDSVLAWKRRQKLGRFDPSTNTKSPDELADERRSNDTKIITQRSIEVGKRCRVGEQDERRGIVKFIGEIQGLGGERERGCVWVGVELDEPVGKNNGSVKVDVGDDGKTETRQVFECRDKFGVFSRPEKIEVGDWPPLDDLDEDMEEL